MQPTNRSKLLIAEALCISALVSIGFFAYGAIWKAGGGYWYLLWNLFLGALPLFFAWLLMKLLVIRPWSSWPGIGLTLLWLGFLPNSFYMITDYIHLPEVASEDLLFYTVLFTSFIVNSLVYGYLSLYMIHKELLKRLPPASVVRTLAVLLLACSFAIYLGRDLRWNTWDVLVNPGGLAFDISERLISPSSYPRIIETIGLFFTLLGSLYLVMWRVLHPATADATSVIMKLNETRVRTVRKFSRTKAVRR